MAVLVLGALGACSKAAPPAPPPGPPPIDEAAAKQAVDALWAKVITADTAGNVDAFLALFAETVQLDVQGFPAIVGRAAMDSTLRPMFAARDFIGFQRAPNLTMVVSNDLVYEGGTYAETYIEKKKTHTEYGRYATAAARGADGEWRVGYWMAIIDSTVGRK
jgi:uncharacterized protein (TIGR02246 family)